MGYNTWNYWHCGVNETVLQQAALAINRTGLQAAGFQYVNSDDCWMLATRDANGNQVPNPDKFPSGIEATVKYIHSLGLSMGLYTARGQHTCAGFAASCGYEAIDAAQYAAWEIDYLKDDNCGSCSDFLTDYGKMQQGLWAAGRPIVLTVEGEPDVRVITYGGYGNAKRVGHDIEPAWKSMVSLVDIGSGLWPYAHGAINASVGGWWNDLDMLEVGNGDFSPSNLAQAQAHMSMWCIMKAPLLMGNDMMTLDNVTLGVLSNAEAISINQDALGIQGRRVAVFQPKNSTLGATPWDIVATVAQCQEGKPTQRWFFKNESSPQQNLLYLQPCDATNVNQKWSFPGSSGAASSLLKNVGTGQCVDSSLNYDPGMLGTCNAASSSQQWVLQTGSNHTVSGSPVHCLDVYMFSGPDVEMGSCKVPGNDDTNQQWQYLPATQQIKSLSYAVSNMCLAAAAGPAGGQLYTIDATGKQWCLSGQGAEGDWTGEPCSQQNRFNFQLMPQSHQAGNFTILTSTGGGVGYNMQFGASGPLPSSRYVIQSTAVFTLDPVGINNGTGSRIQAAANNIINDDLVGNVTTGGDFCLDLTTMGLLEVWVGPLANNRWAVSLFNRSPGDDQVTFTWDMLTFPDGTGVPSSTQFQIRDVWAAANRGVASGSYTAEVAAHSTVLLILTPA